jgi:DNA-binding IclR family transcriptional regulator
MSSLEVKSVGKAFRVLEVFTGREQLLSLGEIASRSHLDKSAAQRFTHTLQKLGYLDQDPVSRRYMLGIRVLDPAFGYLRSHPLIEKAAPILLDLRRTIGERVDLSLLDRGALVYVLRLQSKRESVLTAAHVGLRIPLYCAAGGRAVLAKLGDAEAARMIKGFRYRQHTPKTIIDPELIMRQVRKSRRSGFALQVEQWRLGEIAMGAAITNDLGRPIGAVHVVGSTAEWTAASFEKKMSSHLVAATQAISDGLVT